MIIPEYTSIFVHPPRCAGNTIEQQFRTYLPGYDSRDRGHHTAREYEKLLGPQYFESQFKFTFIRNPYRRFISSYEFHIHKEHSLEWFLTENENQKAVLDERGMIHNGVGAWHRGNLPQYYMLHNEEGKLLVDFIGRVETIDEDWEQVCIKLGIPYKPLPRVNAARDEYKIYKDYREYYTSDVFDRVTKLYQIDLDTFGYEYEE